MDNFVKFFIDSLKKIPIPEIINISWLPVIKSVVNWKQVFCNK